MTVHRLDNARWGFGSQCFVCEPTNELGLRIPFFYDDEADAVRAQFCLGPQLSGPPSYVHGGVVLAILDEAMAWASIASAKVFSLTRTTTATFHRPVRVGHAHGVEARLAGAAEGGSLDAVAHVVDGEDRRCAEARARFEVLSAAQASSAIGDVGGRDAGFLRG